jgi:hypothetical protein
MVNIRKSASCNYNLNVKIDGTVVKGENHGIIITRWFSIFLTVTNKKMLPGI